ncbi:MAG: terminase large subunit, partial [Dichotomicrobium sp.]
MDAGDWFDERAADRACDFFARYLRHHKGRWAGQPFTLEPWQRDQIIRPLFGWRREDGTRRYRVCDVWVPRKNGKTQLAAGVALLLLLGDGERGAEGYAIASKEEQARIVFGAAQAMADNSAKLSKHVEVWKNKIYCPALDGIFRPLSGKPGGKHGLNPSFKIGDELHEWPDDRLDQYVRQGMAARAQPLEFHTSTAGTRTGYGWEVYQYDRKIVDKIIEDPDRLVVIYEAGADDDWQDPEVWAKANPNIGVSVNTGYLEAEAKKAAENPRHENDFKRYHLNIWTEQDVRWLQMDKWARCSAQPDDPDYWKRLPEEMRGRPCFGGIDLSATQDVTALVWVFPPAGADQRLVWVCRFFVPEDNVLERVRRDRVP